MPEPNAAEPNAAEPNAAESPAASHSAESHSAAGSTTRRLPADPDGTAPAAPAEPAESTAPDEPRWVGSAAVPLNKRTRRRGPHFDDTLDLPVVEPEPPVLPRTLPLPPNVPPPPSLPLPPPNLPVPAYPAVAPVQPAYPPHPAVAPAPYPPPGYRPGAYPAYPPAPGYRPPRRRRRRWPWVLLTLLLLVVACCGGVVLVAKSFVDQYPASVATAPDVPGLVHSTDAARLARAKRLLAKIESGQLDEATFALLYADAANRQRLVTVFGTTRLIGSPGSDLDADLATLRGDLTLTGVRKVNPGSLGGQQRCGNGRLDGRAIVVCGWADHGSLGVILSSGRSLADAARLVQTVRAAVVIRW